MGRVIKTFWFKANGEIVDLSKIRETDEFLQKYWYKQKKIVELICFGKTFQLSIKTGGSDTNNFRYTDINFKDKKQLTQFLSRLKP